MPTDYKAPTLLAKDETSQENLGTKAEGLRRRNRGVNQGCIVATKISGDPV